MFWERLGIFLGIVFVMPLISIFLPLLWFAYPVVVGIGFGTLIGLWG